MDWDKHGTSKNSTNRRLAVPITDQLEMALTKFREAYPHKQFKDVAIMKTMIEAGFKVWFANHQTQSQNEQPTEPEMEDA